LTQACGNSSVAIAHSEEFMGFPSRDDPTHPAVPAKLPHLWIGYLLSIAAFFAMVVAVATHAEIASGPLFIPPLYLFLISFVSFVYWLVCVHQLHVVLSRVSGWRHPVSPARAVWFHFIPIYSLYWLYKWPVELGKYVNWKLQREAIKPQRGGLYVFFSYAACLFLGPGGLLLLFFSLSYLNEWLRRALTAPPRSFGDQGHSQN
jgi:hypothetical protein